MSAYPELPELLQRVVQNALASTYVARPARVDSYDAVTQTVTVTPVLQEAVEGTETVEVKAPAQIELVPVCWPRAGDWFLTMPMAVGDYVLLVCSDRALDLWLTQGGTGVNPVDLRRHQITDAIAIPGVYPDPDALTESGIATNLVLGEQTGSTIQIKPNGEIHLGSENASDFVALAALVETGLQTIVDAITNAVPGVSDGGLGLQTTMIAALTDPVASVAATKVKAD